jgi:hypothetical protein
LELAQRIDPDLNVIDRNALSLAYYLKGRYDAAIEQAELNLRGPKARISAGSCWHPPMRRPISPGMRRVS